MDKKTEKILVYGIPTTLLIVFIVAGVLTWKNNGVVNRIIICVIIGLLLLVLFGIILNNVIIKHKLASSQTIAQNGILGTGRLVKIKLNSRMTNQKYVLGKIETEVIEDYCPVIQFNISGKQVRYLTTDVLTPSQVLHLFKKGSVNIKINGEQCILNENLSDIKEEACVELPKELKLSDRYRTRGLVFNRFNFYGTLFFAIMLVGLTIYYGFKPYWFIFWIIS